MYHHKLTHYRENTPSWNKENAAQLLDSQLKKTLSCAMVCLAKEKHQAPTHRLKLYVRAIFESKAWPTVV